MLKEWRIKSLRMCGTFKCFGVDEEAARNFIEVKPREVYLAGKTTLVMKRGDNLASDPIGPYSLESRPAGTSGNDSTWTTEAYRDDERTRAEAEAVGR